MRVITQWFVKHFSNPQVVYLALILVILFAILMLLGRFLAPVLAGLVIAYLLEGLVRKLQLIHVPRLISVFIVFFLFLLFVLIVLLILMPLLSRQVTQLFQQIPSILIELEAMFMKLPERYPELLSAEDVSEFFDTDSMLRQFTQWGRQLLSVGRVVDIITIVVYLVLLPTLVFFFLKDKHRILSWLRGFLPKDYTLTKQVWADVDLQIGNYIRGKFWEILIVCSVTLTTFEFLGLQYAVLLAVVVGLSVLIPFVGAAVVTIPVVLIAWSQFQATPEFWWVVIAYLIIQVLDGNVLVPLLFSEVVNLHPVAIIVAILVFGGIWGLWGVFFAIPLATLVQAVLNAWPKPPDDERTAAPA